MEISVCKVQPRKSKRQLDLGVEELTDINEQQTSSKHLH